MNYKPPFTIGHDEFGAMFVLDGDNRCVSESELTALLNRSIVEGVARPAVTDADTVFIPTDADRAKVAARPAPESMSDETLVQTMLEVYARSCSSGTKHQHDHAFACRDEVMRRLASRLAGCVVVPRDELRDLVEFVGKWHQPAHGSNCRVCRIYSAMLAAARGGK